MSRIYVAVLFLVTTGLFSPTIVDGQTLRPATPEDCLRVKRLQHSDTYWKPIQFDPKGRFVAYGLSEPSLLENQNQVELYVKRIDSGRNELPRMLFRANGISQLHWLGDGRHLLALVREHGQTVIESIDAISSVHHSIIERPQHVKEFSVDPTGQVIVFATEETGAMHANGPTSEDAARGYRIPFEMNQNPGVKNRIIFTTRRIGNSWSRPRRLAIRGSFDKSKIDSFLGVDNHGDLDLSLSPDGKRLIFSYESFAPIPPSWMAHSAVSDIVHSGFPIALMVLVDLNRKTSSIAVQSPWTLTQPFWSPDSRFFAVWSSSPLGTVWEKDDLARHASSIEALHFFVVDANSLQPHLIPMPKVDKPTFDEPLVWSRDGSLLLHAGKDTLVRVVGRNGEWLVDASTVLPLEGEHGYPVLGSNGQVVVGTYETPTAPPEMFLYDLHSHSLQTMAKINAQFDDVEFAHLKHISWETAGRYRIDGALVMPSDFKPGKRYPLVIQTHQMGSEFLCDAGPYGYPSYLPLPLVDAGILYLYRTVTINYKEEDRAHLPKGYPGGIGEAALATEIWDSAVDELSREGIVDPDKVGIIGYSRTGWYTEFALAHARTRYRAASVTDNVEYSLGEYWLSRRPLSMQAYDRMYGGSPYGRMLQSWLDYSVSFNLAKIHTPLLMEQMGYGVHYSDVETLPIGLTTPFEVFGGLSFLHRPVELYYYPNETHTMDHPKARLENLQRNLDWFRFWLQGYERPSPEDAGQYERWHKLATDPENTKEDTDE